MSFVHASVAAWLGCEPSMLTGRPATELGDLAMALDRGRLVREGWMELEDVSLTASSASSALTASTVSAGPERTSVIAVLEMDGSITCHVGARSPSFLRAFAHARESCERWADLAVSSTESTLVSTACQDLLTLGPYARIRIVTQQPSGETGLAVEAEAPGSTGSVEVFSIPIASPGAPPLGNITGWTARTRELGDVERGLLLQSAGQLASLMTAMRQRSLLEARQRSAMQTLAATVAVRDPLRGIHQRRVASLCESVGHALALAPSRVTLLAEIGLVHDLGMLRIPTDLLNKPARLTAPERNLVSEHSSVGSELIGLMMISPVVAETIRQHHERLDGSGYPRNLGGDELSLEARILGAVDVFEAMCSHRPHRPALGVQRAMDELRRHRAERFDGDVVDALEALVSEPGFDLPPHGF